MAHLFTPRHREKQARPVDHELFHGHYCESMYLLGMELSAKVKELTLAIRYKRCAIDTLRKTARRTNTNSEAYWNEVNKIRCDGRTVEYVQDQLKTAKKQLAIVRFNYEIGFMVNRQFDTLTIIHAIQWKNKLSREEATISANIAIEKIRTFDHLQSVGYKISKMPDDGRQPPITEPENFLIRVMGQSLHFPATITMTLEKGLGKS